MSVQTKYSYATGKGIAGGIFDMYHYSIDSRFNEDKNGVLRFGVGVVKGSIAGSNIKLPATGATAADFEGVVVNGFSNQHDLEGKVYIMNNQNVGVMRKGRIWVIVADGEEPVYGDPVHMMIEGEEAGCFATTGGIEIAGRFIGSANRGVAPVELYGIEIARSATDSTDTGSEQG